MVDNRDPQMLMRARSPYILCVVTIDWMCKYFRRRTILEFSSRCEWYFDPLRRTPQVMVR